MQPNGDSAGVRIVVAPACSKTCSRYNAWLAQLRVGYDEAVLMPKMKTHKGLAKRVKVSARGKVHFNKSCAGHLMSGKNGQRKRRLRKRNVVTSVIAAKIRRALNV